MRVKPLIIVLLTLIAIAYPFMVYTGLNNYGVKNFSLALIVLIILRLMAGGQLFSASHALMLLPVGALCALAAFQDSETLLRYYPVVMSLCVATLFLVSLKSDKPLTERVAEKFLENIQPHQKRYLRGLTLVWAIFLTSNALVAGFTACCTTLSTWALYNGLISYILTGFFIAGELIYRHYYKKRYYQPN